MSRLLCMIAPVLALGVLPAEPVAAQASRPAAHEIRLIADAGKDEYRFEPATLTVRPGDAIVFRVASGAPHSVVFEGDGMSPGVRGSFNAAMPSRSGDLSSPLLTAAGKEYRMVVPQVPAGTYGFYCLPHRAYDMRGSIQIQ